MNMMLKKMKKRKEKMVKSEKKKNEVLTVNYRYNGNSIKWLKSNKKTAQLLI